MKNFFKKFFLLLLLSRIYATEPPELCSTGIFNDLEEVEKINKKINDRLPLLLNYVIQGGYFTMPSARMPDTGVVSVGYSYLPPYRVFSGGFQYFSHVELTANYWVFHGLPEWNFGHLGFGDDADRAANIKVALLKKTDGIPFLPELALGINDFIGTKRFHSFFIVGTQEFLDYDLEMSLGWGTGRIKGFFGGIAWSPFRLSKYFFKNLSVIAEYDANNYRNHKHEHDWGRTQKWPVNLGAHITLFKDVLHVTASTLRGETYAVSGMLSYNLGDSKGFFPKFGDALEYTSPVNVEPLGKRRSQEELAQELAYAFQEQGFTLTLLKSTTDKKNHNQLYLRVINSQYLKEGIIRERIQHILAALMPLDYVSAKVVIESDAVYTQEYEFHNDFLEKYRKGKIGPFEMGVVSPLQEITKEPGKYDSSLIYRNNKKVWSFVIRPTMQNYFGSSQGKLKYDVGVLAGLEGYLFNQLYYYLETTYIVKSNAGDIRDRDFYNPSQLLNVFTDHINYVQSGSFHVNCAFVQQNWTLGRGWLAKLALGYLDVAYAGAGLEVLYYPVNSLWAIGFECAPLIKRTYHGLGFTNKVRKFHGDQVEYVKYYGLQYFADFYYQFQPLRLDFRISVGQFLARDKGAKFEMRKCFKSGLKVGMWYTLTDANDKVNGKTYFDKGFFFSIPLDLFLSKSSKRKIMYSMSAWLRDAGARISAGIPLYPIIYDDRQPYY